MIRETVMHRWCVWVFAVGVVTGSKGVLATPTVTIAAEPNPVTQGNGTLLTIRLSPETAIFGYTLQLHATRQDGSVGTVAFDPAGSDFGGGQALIPDSLRDGGFTSLTLMGNDLLCSTNTNNLSTVTPVVGTNDVLLRASLVASADAVGRWVIGVVRPPSVLGDPTGNEIPATWETATVEVVAPTPTPAPRPSACCGAAGPLELPFAVLAMSLYLLRMVRGSVVRSRRR